MSKKLIQVRANLRMPGSYGVTTERILTEWNEEEKGMELFEEYQRKFKFGKLPEATLIYYVSRKNYGPEDAVSIPPERAIQILDPKHREKYDASPDGMAQVNEACRMAMKVLGHCCVEKEVQLEGDGYDPDGNMVYDTAFCPECHREFEEDSESWGAEFCPACGQALKWREDGR